MLKLSSFLKEAATNVAQIMLKEGLSENSIPEMPSCTISQKNVCPEGHVPMGNITEQGVRFYLFQKF